MWRWHWKKYGGRRMGKILLDSAASIDKWRSVLVLWGGAFLGLLFISTPLGDAVMNTWHLLPSWSVPVFLLVSLVILFVRGLVKANYDKFTEVEDRKCVLQRQLDDRIKRKAVKDLLGEAEKQGKSLRGPMRKVGNDFRYNTKDDIEDWVHRTHDFIEAALDKGEARLFLDSSEDMPKNPLATEEMPVVDTYEYHLEPGLRRLQELIVRANDLEVNSDFYARYWMDRFNLQ
jgi:hypothetical protein